MYVKAPKRAPKYGTKAGMSQKPLNKLSFSEKKTPLNALYFIATYKRGPKSRAGFIADLKNHKKLCNANNTHTRK